MTHHASFSLPAAMTEENRRFLRRWIHKASGIVISNQKDYLLDARLAPILAKRKLSSLNELCKLLRGSEDPNLCIDVTEAVTTHESYFFRDPAQFQALHNVIPELLAARLPHRKLTFWSAAASRGQEAYSLAILLARMPKAKWAFEILGTDLSSRAVKQAREATYSERELSRGLQPDQIRKHFERHGSGWRVVA